MAVLFFSKQACVESGTEESAKYTPCARPGMFNTAFKMVLFEMVPSVRGLWMDPKIAVHHAYVANMKHDNSAMVY